MIGLPLEPFDGQVFLDAFKVKWVFSGEDGCWLREGVQQAIPVATNSQSGLLSKELQYTLDRVQPKGGGFAIMTKPPNRRTPANPDGLLYGDIQLVSESLALKCVNSNGDPITDKCQIIAFTENDTQPPGFDIGFSDNFLASFCVDVPGGPGPKGPEGYQGATGADGTSDGPQGLKGPAGKDATSAYKLTGLKIVELDDISDTAVVKMDLDNQGGKLLVTKAKINVPTEDTPADKVIAHQINRLIKFKKCWEYDLVPAPCGPDDTFDTADPTIAYYPSHFDPQNTDVNEYQLVRSKLSVLVNEIIAKYQAKLEEAATKYDKDIEEFIFSKDAEARKVLDELGDRLAECENITYLDFCVGVEPCEGAGTAGGGSGAVPNLTCQSFSQLLGLALAPEGMKCTLIGNADLSKQPAPVFSFKAPEPFDMSKMGGTLVNPVSGATALTQIANFAKAGDKWIWGLQPNGNLIVIDTKNPSLPDTPLSLYGAPNGLLPKVQIGGDDRSIAIAYDLWINKLREAIKAGSLIYPKQQLRFSPSSNEFPAGNYALNYRGGVATQEMLCPKLYKETLDLDACASDKVNGAFQQFYLGNETQTYNDAIGYWNHFTGLPVGDGFLVGSAFSTIIGVQFGHAPTTYKTKIPDNYFQKYYWDPQSINTRHAPCTHVDFTGLPQDALEMEKQITWVDMPVFQGFPRDYTKDAKAFENKYFSAKVTERAVIIKMTEPGFLFVRIRTAYSALNFDGELILAPAGSGGYGTTNLFYNPPTAMRQWPLRGIINASLIPSVSLKLELKNIDLGSSGATGSTGPTAAVG